MASAQTTSLLITALGGALGALILRSALKLIGALWSRAKPLAVHQCESSGSNPGEFDPSMAPISMTSENPDFIAYGLEFVRNTFRKRRNPFLHSM
ncbi:MAG: hypothetical protein AMJ53_14465 [Gammaproteobacteria bacterium SG8_11]|nr:MAG: hypothetical protein AMJ53_14465 [Gammaproteobacteria bacterium SG8_11]